MKGFSLNEQDFVFAAPSSPSKKEREQLKNNQQRENRVALDIMFRVHHFLYSGSVALTPQLVSLLKRYQSLAFAGFHPSEEELDQLETVSSSESLRNFAQSTRNLIKKQRYKWNFADYNQDEVIMHQDTEAVAEFASKLNGEERIIFFGSARKNEGTAEYEATRWLSSTLVEGLPHNDGTTEQVITGGGPGIMEAANRGALEGAWKHYQRLLEAVKNEGNPEELIQKINLFRAQMHSIGVGIIVPHEQSWNKFLQANLTIKSFSPRKVGLVSVAAGRSIKAPKESIAKGKGKRKPAIFAMPGGMGTLDELWEVATLMQCKKMPTIPIFVVGPMAEIAKLTLEKLAAIKTIAEKDLNLFCFCKDEKEALEKYLEHYNLSPNSIISSAIDQRGSIQ
jgi:hypothetical protein